METIVQHQEQIQYAEVYISDLLILKNIFLQAQDDKTVNRGFGLPFLLAKDKNEIIAFASLIINGKDGITFKMFNKKRMPETEKENFALKAERYFKKNNTPNFRNADQLKSSISNMVDWLNF
ncbi:hypothetical protein [Chryseobacterium sp.]|uniref:hypothetical protein n=1 Tax=Chryseobacterium sp. TaxID=1871047 RepID=UPI0028A1EF5C|nr:hypothetical protein [Chryseobacterium sp.]